jgi:hypothetical protein
MFRKIKILVSLSLVWGLGLVYNSEVQGKTCLQQCLTNLNQCDVLNSITPKKYKKDCKAEQRQCESNCFKKK